MSSRKAMTPPPVVAPTARASTSSPASDDRAEERADTAALRRPCSGPGPTRRDPGSTDSYCATEQRLAAAQGRSSRAAPTASVVLSRRPAVGPLPVESRVHVEQPLAGSGGEGRRRPV